MLINFPELSAAISKAFPDAKFKLQDTVGDNNHYDLEIYSKDLSGLPRIKQHRAVYNAIIKVFGFMPHALSIKILNTE